MTIFTRKSPADGRAFLMYRAHAVRSQLVAPGLKQYVPVVFLVDVDTAALMVDVKLDVLDLGLCDRLVYLHRYVPAAGVAVSARIIIFWK